VPRRARVVVASGGAKSISNQALAKTLRTELDHLREVLDACERAGATRIVVLGSADVAGTGGRIDGTSPQDPTTPYATVKAALEDECVRRHRDGVPVTSLRLAPVHGPGKARTASMVRWARSPIVPLPNGGYQSIGFILLDDAVRAITWALQTDATQPVMSVGGGDTSLRSLLAHLARAQGRRVVQVPVPMPAAVLRPMLRPRLPPSASWLIRLAVGSVVTMEPPVDVTPLPEAAEILVGAS
jgi:nucleoside-diphosphate-sugar epimerase